MKTAKNGWEEALQNLLQVQAAFLAQNTETNRDLAELKREWLELKRIDQELERESNQKFSALMKVMADFAQYLERLPEALREKIGFKKE